MARSAELNAEVNVMASIERALSRIDELTPAAQARVRRWVSETFIQPSDNGQQPSQETKP